MRRISTIFSVLLVISLLEGHVNGYASAPGTYPDEEMRAGSDMEVPKNPYQNGWTGYDFYYEKEPKAPTLGDSGTMPAFQSIEEVTSDRETPEDPGSSVYQAAGSESGPKKPATTTSKPVTESKVSDSEKVMVSPSFSTKDFPITTTVAPSTSTIPPVKDTEPSAPAQSSTLSPDSGSDQSAADQLELLYGGGGVSGGATENKENEKKDVLVTTVSTTVSTTPAPRHDPPPPAPTLPQNLLTTLIEKKKPGRTRPEDSYDAPTGYGDSGPGDSHESGYGAGNSRSSKWEGLNRKGQPPGTEPKTGGSGSEYGNDVYNKPSKPNAQTKMTPSSSTSSPTTAAKDRKSNSLPAPEAYSIKPSLPGSSEYGSSTPPEAARPGSYNLPPKTLQFSKLNLKTPDTVPPNLLESINFSNPSRTNNNPDLMPTITEAHGFYGKPILPESQTDYDSDPTMPTHPSTENRNPGSAPGEEPSSPESGYPAPQSVPTFIPDVLDYGARVNNHIGKVSKTSNSVPQPSSPMDGSESYSNSNNAISSRDPYDHFGSTHHRAPSPPPPSRTSSSTTSQNHFTHGNFEEDPNDVYDSGYGGDNNDINIVPLRSSASSPSTTSTSNTEVRAQISEIDRIAESFENSAREPVEYENKITSESSKGITVEAGKAIQKHFGRRAKKCCSCCDEKQPVSRNIETKVAPNVQQAVDPSRQLGERDPVESFVPLQSTVGGSAYVQQPAAPQQTYYQQPFQQYQPQYPQSYSYQQPSCGCQPQPQNCCAPPAPCCLPTIPCCPPIPCCPQPKICCQPTPICLPPQQCCSINFKLPTIPICGRACPSCPCRRRVHKSRRLKRHAISTNCHQCSAAGEPWKAVLHHHRQKRAAPGCSSGFSTMQQNSCGTCGASNLRSARVKRMGCLPCLGRKKRDTDENSHIRVKRMGCLPCLNGRKKRSALSPSSGCSQCNSLGHLFNRYKRSLFGCSPCAPQPPCGCQGRKKRSVSVKIIKRAPEQCDATCCDYSKCLNRQKKETLVPFM